MEQNGMRNLFVKSKKEILRYAQNDKKRRARNDIRGKAHNDMEMA
jgi:hypothetical protein